MKKISQLLQSLFCFVALALTATTATAEVVEMEDGGSYQISAFKPWRGSFQASSDGILTLTSQDLITYYGTDATFSHSSNNYTHAYVGGKNQIQVTVNTGNTYYFMFEFPMDNQVLSVSMKSNAEGKVLLTSIEPAEGSVLDVTGTAQIVATFDTQVRCSSAILSAGTNNASLTTEASQNYICSTYKSELFGWLKSGAVKEGDDVTLTISDIHSTLNTDLIYGDNGVLTATFKAPAKPVEMISATYPHAMQAYWEKGDADGIATFTFDGTLYSGDDPLLKPIISLTYGNIESDNVKIYDDITTTIQNNVIVVDFTGVNREMPKGDDGNFFVLSIENVHTADGKSVYSTNAGSIGSFAFVMGIQMNVIDVVTEFTPAGGSLDGLNSIELWIRGVSAISYNGVAFTYEKDGNSFETIVPQDKLSIDTDDAEDEATITIPIPNAVKTADAGTIVMVSLNELHNLDGVARSIYAVYTAPENTGDQFIIELITPEEGSTLAALVEDEWIKVKSSCNCYLEYRVDDITADEVLKSAAWLNLLDDGTNGAQFPITINLLKGHDFAIVVTGWADEQTRWTNEQNTLGEYSFTIHGDGKAFEYSTLELVSITPHPNDFEITEIEDTNITVTFSGTVSEVRAGRSSQGFGLNPFPAQPINEDGSQWIITIPAHIIASCTSYLDIQLFANDAEGRPLVGEYGVENNSHWELNYVCTAGSPDLIVTPAKGEVESLTEIHIGYNSGISSLYNYMAGDIILYKGTDDEQTIVATWNTNYFDISNGNITQYSGNNIVDWTLLIDNAITEPGTYTLVIPSSFFALGNGMMNYNNKKTIVTYTISNGSTDIDEVLDSETDNSQYRSGNGIYTIGGMKVIPNLKGIYIINGKKWVLK